MLTALGMPKTSARPGSPAGAVRRPESAAAPREALADSFGRIATDLRVSVTDRCSLRCRYCMPAEGLHWLPRDELLTDGELLRLVALFVGLGVRQIRLTGGEPLLRGSLVDLVREFAALQPRPTIAMTTNGIGLARLAQPLADAGLDRVNVSLDTIDRADFAQLTRRDRLPDVVDGLAAAARAGLDPVKVNAVAMPRITERAAVPLLRWCLERGYQMRFIEQMPLDAQRDWDRSRLVTADEVRGYLSGHVELTPAAPEGRGSAPAELFLVDGGPATVGIIASVTRPFCRDCDRIRLTADGQLRTCLFATTEADLRGPLRAGAGDADLAAIVATHMWGKQPGHDIGSAAFEQPARPMSAIGG